MDKNKQPLIIPEAIKKDWRLPRSLYIVTTMLILALLFYWLPFYQTIDSSMAVIQYQGWTATFANNGTLHPSIIAIVGFVLQIIAALSALTFALLLKLRRSDGRRRFSLIVISLIMIIVSFIFNFLAIVEFKQINDLSLLTVKYDYGLILNGMFLLATIYIEWFFLIKIRYYLK